MVLLSFSATHNNEDDDFTLFLFIFSEGLVGLINLTLGVTRFVFDDL